MRWLKIPLALFTLILLTLATLYTARNKVVLHLAQNYLAPYQVEASCAELTLRQNLDIKFDRLCLNHRLAKARLTDLAVTWRWSWQAPFGFTKEIHRIELAQLNVTGNGPLTSEKTKDPAPFSPAVFHTIMADLSQLSLPVPLEVKQFAYQPYGQADRYPGSLSINKNNLQLGLTTNHNEAVIKLSVTAQNNTLSGTIATDFVHVRDFLNTHQINISQQSRIQGKLNTEFNWENNRFNAKNHLKGLFISHQGNQLHGDLKWQTTLHNERFTIEFRSSSPITFDLQDQWLRELLSQKDMPPQLIELLKYNPTNGLSLHPQGKLTLDFAAKTLGLDKLFIATVNSEQPMNITLSALTTDLAFEQISADYTSNIVAKLPQLQPYTDMPVSLSSQGQISKTAEHTKLNWSAGSGMQLNNLKQQKHRAQDLAIQWQGQVILGKNGPPEFDLSIDGQLKRALVHNMFKADSTDFKATLTGNLNNIKLTGGLTADTLALANFNITGDPRQPNIKLQGKAIPLPDLMPLILYRPVEVELLDGQLDYELTGQVEDLAQPAQGPFELNMAVNSLSGTVKKTWLQDLNYRHKLTIKGDSVLAPPLKDNLKLALMEAAGKITELTASIGFERVQQRFSLSAENVSGKAFDGSFALDRLTWPLSADKATLLGLDKINLAQLVALEKQDGIVVTGKLSGQLPMYFQQDTVTISDGKLYNVGDGVIQIKDNPAVARLKQAQSSLKLAFDALENLHYHTLTSDVTMSDDGQMLMETVIKGHNPDLDNEVNFNLNLDYDLLGLLKSMMIADTLEQQLTEKVNTQKEKP